jgi:hypothetical protein
MNRVDACEALLRRHDGRHVEQSKSRRVAGRSFDPIGISDAAAEHLIAAAEAKHVSAAAMMRKKVNVPALRAQEGEVATGRL